VATPPGVAEPKPATRFVIHRPMRRAPRH
jgi:hypothetical protein